MNQRFPQSGPRLRWYLDLLPLSFMRFLRLFFHEVEEQELDEWWIDLGGEA